MDLNNLKDTFSCLSDCACLDVNDGWSEIIINLLHEVEMENSNLDQLKKIKITYIKQKFGSLRVYSENMTLRINALIEKAETISHTICEDCGSKDKIVESLRWTKAICEDCFNK